MPKIYLRVTFYEASYLRSPDADGSTWPKSQPLTFPDISAAADIIKAGLTIIPESQQYKAQCYGGRAWQNMMAGRPPEGGKRALMRDNFDVWLTVPEVRFLTGIKRTLLDESCDFICINVPAEIRKDNRIIKVSPSHTLDLSSARALRREVHKLFIRGLLLYKQRSRYYCIANGIDRADTEILERFYADHDIPVGHTSREIESMRRQSRRWLQEAEELIKSESNESITRESAGDAHSPLFSYQALNNVNKSETDS